MISTSPKEACQFDEGDTVCIRPDKFHPEGILAQVVEVDGHPGDTGILTCEWADESGRMVKALFPPESLVLVKKG